MKLFARRVPQVGCVLGRPCHCGYVLLYIPYESAGGVPFGPQPHGHEGGSTHPV